MPEALRRCEWCGEDELYVAYHDHEWGVPVHDDPRLFELLSLEGAQAGLSWITILRKREGYRRAFEGFDPTRVAAYSPERVDSLVADAGIVRHRGKITSVVTNAACVLEVQRHYGSFDQYVWQLAREDAEPRRSATAMSKRLRTDGFAFVGPMTCYSFMQAAGMVNDHDPTCFRYPEVERLRHA